jgi:putative tricarboxylic transport membrane protein
MIALLQTQSIVSGFEVVLQPINLFYVFAGVLIGMVIGVLPGLGPAATIALLLPTTYVIPPESAVILLAGIYYGAYYGGTITSILLRLPGEAATVVTTFDGYQMAQQGRAGPALGIAAIGSFIGGIISVVGLIFLAPILASFALSFGPPELTALAVLGLLLVTYLGTTSFVKSLIVAGFGLLLATVGIDPISGMARFTFGSTDLLRGLDFVAIVMGVFGLGEVLYNLDQEGRMSTVTSRISRVWPTMRDWAQARGAIFRGSVLGFFIGVLPGGGGLVSSLASYALEKRLAREPERFGNGAIEGVAGPETANNAGSTSSFIPLLTLGIPPNVVLALIMGALLIQGIIPGPQLINQHPQIFWGVIASMVIGNLVLLILNIPLVGVFVQLLRVRMGILAALIVVVTMIGVYSVNNNVSDIWIMLVFGALGYVMRKTGFEPGPLALAFVLGPILEQSFRQSVLISGGSPDIFFTRPISGALFGIALLIIVFSIFQFIRKTYRSVQRQD